MPTTHIAKKYYFTLKVTIWKRLWTVPNPKMRKVHSRNFHFAFPPYQQLTVAVYLLPYPKKQMLTGTTSYFKRHSPCKTVVSPCE